MWQAASVNLFIHCFIQYLFNVFHVPVMVLGIPFTVPWPLRVYNLATHFPRHLSLQIMKTGENGRTVRTWIREE